MVDATEFLPPGAFAPVELLEGGRMIDENLENPARAFETR